MYTHIFCGNQIQQMQKQVKPNWISHGEKNIVVPKFYCMEVFKRKIQFLKLN